MTKSQNRKLIRATSLNECREHRCDDLKAYKSSQLTDLYFKPMQNSPVRGIFLDFHVMWIWQFRRVDSVVFVFCTKFGSNICYSHWDRRTHAEDLNLMTSRKLTSGFDFWSRGHLCMAVMHLHIKFGADIFIQSGVIVIFLKFKMAAAAILDFQIM